MRRFGQRLAFYRTPCYIYFSAAPNWLGAEGHTGIQEQVIFEVCQKSEDRGHRSVRGD
jgi:hypothetical protein